MEKYMSGDELREYLHISKRKLKYLLEKGYIPYTDTGRKTHKYKVAFSDAEAFKRRMEANPRMLRSLDGCFSSRSTVPISERVTEKQITTYIDYLQRLWKDYPEYVTTATAAKMTGITMETLRHNAAAGYITTATLRGRVYILKADLISHLATPRMMFLSSNPTLRRLIDDFCRKYGLELLSEDVTPKD